ncbi:unnamed protein product [Fraxinus pennsylvanica]|uniref:KNOX1 domain-containing protein n=1 Tax=Fraxinus pennsylvanica TaxID=56036 RepID=A0AAD1Z676_9LAMI|nr:unnamed protein product [Fraxinus pennsylvanica]
MDEYNQLGENTISSRSNFLYGGSLFAPRSSLYGRTNNGSNNQQSRFPIKIFHHQSIDWYEQSEGQGHTAVKTEAGTSQNHAPKFHYPRIIRGHHSIQDNRPRQQDYENSSEVDAIKDKIIAPPQYSNLLEVYMDCQKVGAAPEVVAQITAVLQEFETRQRASASSRDDPKDPELDQFMPKLHSSGHSLLTKRRGPALNVIILIAGPAPECERAVTHAVNRDVVVAELKIRFGSIMQYTMMEIIRPLSSRSLTGAI